MRKNDMEIMLRLRCAGCGECFIVEDDQPGLCQRYLTKTGG